MLLHKAMLLRQRVVTTRGRWYTFPKQFEHLLLPGTLTLEQLEKYLYVFYMYFTRKNRLQLCGDFTLQVPIFYREVFEF